MKKNNQHINDDFLARLLAGETTKEEQKRIISWLEEKKKTVNIWINWKSFG